MDLNINHYIYRSIWHFILIFLIVEKPQSAMGSQAAVKLEDFGAVKPALLPLFPPLPSCGMSSSPVWPELLEGGRRRAVAPRPLGNASMDDFYLGSSLGYSSSDFALAKTHESGRATMSFGSFFDEVASFSKVDDAGLAAVGNAFGHGSS